MFRVAFDLPRTLKTYKQDLKRKLRKAAAHLLLFLSFPMNALAYSLAKLGLDNYFLALRLTDLETNVHLITPTMSNAMTRTSVQD